MDILSGTRISELDRQTSIGNEDLFLISRHYNPQLENEFSKALRFETLADDTIRQIQDVFNLSSMAFQRAEDYSSKYHGHNYTNVMIYSRQPQGGDEYVKLGTLCAENNGTESKLDINLPLSAVNGMEHKGDHTIGELKFVAVNNIGPIDIDADDFDGWVYPDGSSYQKNRFPEAWEVFASNRSSTTFNVPNLRQYMKLNPNTLSTNSIRHVNGCSDGIPSHVHDANVNGKSLGDFKLTCNMNINGNHTADDDGQSAPKIHMGAIPSKDLGDVACSLSVIQANINADVQIEQSGNTETVHPTYNLVPVMIYIGGERQ